MPRNHHHKALKPAVSLPHDGTWTVPPPDLDPLNACQTLHQQLQWLRQPQRWLETNSAASVHHCLLEWMVSYQTPTELRRVIYNSALRDRVHPNVWQSLLESVLEEEEEDSTVWKRPLSSLFCILQYHSVVDFQPVLECLERHSRFLQVPVVEKEDTCDLEMILDDMLWIPTILKDMPSNLSRIYNVTQLHAFLWRWWQSGKILGDHALSVVSVALGRTLSPDVTVEQLRQCATTLSSPLHRAYYWQGCTGTLPASTENIHLVLQDCLDVSRCQADPDVRVAAWKSAQSIWERFENLSIDGSQVLECLLLAWENPPTRKLGHTIASCFDSLTRHLTERSNMDVERLVQRLLEQPAHRKGKYTALEKLLPLIDPFILERHKDMLGVLIQGVGDHGHNNGAIADLWAKILAKLHSVDDWNVIWMDSLLDALTVVESSRRKKVSAFCLPRVPVMTNHDNVRTVQCFADILTSLGDRTFEHNQLSKERETPRDRVLWAQLEVIRYASLDLVWKMDSVHGPLMASVRQSFSKKRLRWSLIHSSPSIRLTAFRALTPIVQAHESMDLLLCTKQEMQIWENALPFSVKIEGRDNLGALMLCLVYFLDRLLQCGATQKGKEEVSVDSPHHLFVEFAGGFLLDDLVVKKAGYPGTVLCKENFVLALLENLIAFSCREHPLSRSNKLIPKTCALLTRRRTDVECRLIGELVAKLLGFDVISGVTGMLYSSWDHTKVHASRILNGLIVLARITGVDLPGVYRFGQDRSRIELIGLHLASSPRQREADTGSRILAFLFWLLDSDQERTKLLSRLITVLDVRIDVMKQTLVTLLTANSIEGNAAEMPLAYGIVSSLRLMIDSVSLGSDPVFNDLFDRLANLFCKAIRVAVSVVADIDEGQSIEGMDEDLLVNSAERKPEQVNPGAIGANGIFSSVKHASHAELLKRGSSQRIVVGTWLLTKETCAAISTLFAHGVYNPTPLLMDRAGLLLINTLTTLKHTGAAYAAHQTLQDIAKACLRSKEEQTTFPFQWTSRLLNEVATPEKIRDSTLRRSQGYALGFLALMRAEIASKSAARPLCDLVVKELLRFSLPPEKWIAGFCERICLDEKSARSLLVIDTNESLWTADEDSYNCRSRVHALNSLRFLLQDASMSSFTFPCVGICMISSIMGYVDDEWSVRNSATMVMAAAMLRSIDSDKNALSKDLTGERATTAYELFNAYPSLASFLLAVLKAGVEGSFVGEKSSLPPMLPILLLFSRIQPLLHSSHDSVSKIEPFIPVLFRCLESRLLAIRQSAATALRNLASMNEDSNSYLEALLNKCISGSEVSARDCSWNLLHGHLLVVYELVSNFGEARDLANCMRFTEKLSAIVEMHQRTLTAPPPCVAIVMQIVSMLQEVGAESTFMSLVRDFDCSSARSPNLEALLGSSTAKLLSRSIWNGNSPVAMDGLEALLSSSSADIRMAAVKSFKKEIYDGIDRTILGSKDSLDRLESVFAILWKATTHEICLGVDAHSPSLRRLTRCLLECFDHGAQGPENGLNSWEGLFSSGVSESAQLKRDDSAPFFQTTLYGNIIEIQAILDEKGGKSGAVAQKTAESVSALARASWNWRLRHSAARALGHLGILDHPNEMCFRILVTWCGLMQDEDVDVRQAAAECFEEHYTVHELHLQHRFWKVLSTFSREDAMNQIFTGLLKLIGPFDAVLKKLSAQDLGAGNVFAADATDSYYEICFEGQIGVFFASQLLDKEMNFESVACSVVAILELANDVLSRLKPVENLASSGALHGISRDRSMFGHLHNLLLGTVLAMALSSNCASMTNSPQNDERFLRIEAAAEALFADESHLVHPLINEAAGLVGIASTAEIGKVVLLLQESCFLLRTTPECT